MRTIDCKLVAVLDHSMFPPPWPWQQVAIIDAERTYAAFTSRFFLRSPLDVPGFTHHTVNIARQMRAIPGLVGWSLAADLHRLEFHTLSAWEDARSLHAFVQAGAHGTAVQKLRSATRKDSIFVEFTVTGAELPLSWADALARQGKAKEGPPGGGPSNRS